MVMSSLFQQQGTIKTKMKNPPLDQTEGPRDEDQARKLSHPKNQLVRRAGDNKFFERGSKISTHTDLNEIYTYRVHYRCDDVILLKRKKSSKLLMKQLGFANIPEGRPYPHNLAMPLNGLIPNARGRFVKLWSRYATNMETSKDVYSRYKIIAVTSLKIMEFFGYKHLEEITVRREDDQLYMF
ncbi:hypothetical protein Tco_1556459 [Tanacetum coccineum]